MQVSWIDSDQLKGLLERLGDGVPQSKPGAVAWETHTLPGEEQAGQEPAAELARPGKAASEEGRIKGVSAPFEVKAAVAKADENEAGQEYGARPEEVAPEVERIRDRLRQVRERAEAAGLLKSPALRMAPRKEPPPEVEAPAAVESPRFEAPAGTLVQRMEAFAKWTQSRISPGEMLLLDEHGDVLWGAQAKGPLILSAMLAAKALSRSSAAGACQTEIPVVRQVLGSGGELAVLSCLTPAGLLHLAVEHPTGVDDSEMRLLAAALNMAISGAA